MQTYFDRAAATHIGLSSDNIPLPIGVGKKGKAFETMKSATSTSALEYAAPDSTIHQLIHLIGSM